MAAHAPAAEAATGSASAPGEPAGAGDRRHLRPRPGGRDHLLEHRRRRALRLDESRGAGQGVARAAPYGISAATSRDRGGRRARGGLGGRAVPPAADCHTLVVASRWSLQRDDYGRPLAILEL